MRKTEPTTGDVRGKKLHAFLPGIESAAGEGIKAPFTSGNFWLLVSVALSFLFGKNYSIIYYLGLKDSSHYFSANCVISFFFVYI